MDVRLRVVNPLQKSILNPLVRRAFGLGIPPPGDALLETRGRRTRLRRITPVCDCTEGDTFWVVAQHGRRANYVRNIEADPRVRVCASLHLDAGWRTGTAHILDDDDAGERRRMLVRTNFWTGLCVSAAGAIGTSPLTIRIDLDPS